jgi:sigma-E factor negative regulatory protein RseA
MSEQLHEQLSALMDGELPRDELRFLLRRLDADAGAVQVWSRYHIVSGALRRQTGVPVPLDFSATVMLRIAADTPPAVAGRRRGILLRRVVGGAIAATVAVVALVATRPAGENPANSMPASMPAIAGLPATPSSASQVARQFSAPSPMLANFNYAQPASFDSTTFDNAAFDNVIPLPRYDLRRRYDAGVDNVNGFAPYVLLTAPERAPQTAVPAQQLQQRPAHQPQP